MNDFNHFAKEVFDRWGNKTLADFRFEAAAESTGSVFESVRVHDGPRMMLILCTTNPTQISAVEKILNLGDAGEAADWFETTLAEMVFRTETKDGMSYEDARDKDGRRSAIILCATRREPIRMLETAFNLAPQ